MNRNISVFGPSHSGKSTLIGYILATIYNYDLDSYEKDWRKEYGKDYNPANFYAYFCDKGADEIKEQNNSIGTTKRIHIKPVKADYFGVFDSTISFIDTPGTRTERTWKDRYHGVFLGEIGIYVIEIEKVLRIINMQYGSARYNNAISDIFTPILLWKNFKDINKLIIVLSKQDDPTVNFSSEKYNAAVQTINSILRADEIPVIPTSIEVSKRTGHNIFSSSNEMHYYARDTLIESLGKLISSNLKENKSDTIFACINRKMKTKDTNETAFRIKMLNGAILQSNRLKLGPVKMKNNSELSFLDSDIKSLKIEQKMIAEELREGNIGGVIFKRFSSSNNRFNIEDFEIMKTSIITGIYQETASGNLIFGTANASTDIGIMNLLPGTRINLIWFGHIISTTLLEKKYTGTGNDWSIALYNSDYKENGLFTIPLSNSELVLNKFAIELSDKSSAAFNIKTIMDARSIDKYAISLEFSLNYIEANTIEKWFSFFAPRINYLSNYCYIDFNIVENIEESVLIMKTMADFFREYKSNFAKIYEHVSFKMVIGP